MTRYRPRSLFCSVGLVRVTYCFALHIEDDRRCGTLYV